MFTSLSAGVFTILSAGLEHWDVSLSTGVLTSQSAEVFTSQSTGVFNSLTAE